MRILIFGSGAMAREYLKVLKSLGCQVVVIGRDNLRAEQAAGAFGFEGFGGGIDALKHIEPGRIDYVVNVAHVDALTEINLACLKAGLKNILVEKPGALNRDELEKVRKAAPKGAKIHVAFNRRFYNSVLDLERHIKKDEGVEGCFFDFTDREKDILTNPWSRSVVKRWGWANAAHVIDLAFFLIGKPKAMHVLKSGSFKGLHNGATFVGCGETNQCLFSYFATWKGGGRWNVEISTSRGRYKLSPLEELKFCAKNQFAWEDLAPVDQDDVNFKPGIYKMVKSVILENDARRLPDLSQQIQFSQTIKKIFAYEQ